MDKASASGAGDSRFESWADQECSQQDCCARRSSSIQPPPLPAHFSADIAVTWGTWADGVRAVHPGGWQAFWRRHRPRSWHAQGSALARALAHLAWAYSAVLPSHPSLSFRWAALGPQRVGRARPHRERSAHWLRALAFARRATGGGQLAAWPGHRGVIFVFLFFVFFFSAGCARKKQQCVDIRILTGGLLA